jgi:hypothetical protein
MLAKIAGVEVPKKSARRPVAATDERERVLFDEISQTLGPREALNIAAVCELALVLERPIMAVAEDVRRAADVLGVACSWSDEDLRSAAAFSENDWKIAEGPHVWGARKKFRAYTKVRLAALISRNSYAFVAVDKNASQLLSRIDKVYSLFGWGPVPLTVAEVELALSLDYTDTTVLDVVPTTGALSIPRLVAISATSDLTLPKLSAVLDKIAPFGIKGPCPDDSYLGIAWSDVLRDCAALVVDVATLPVTDVTSQVSPQPSSTTGPRPTPEPSSPPADTD